MFTGIIEEIGVVNNIARGSRSCRINISCMRVIEDVAIGDSIAVNGVCLTVAAIGNNLITADIMPETFEHTTLKALHNGSRVNLERALRLQDRLGGHLVQGHVDGTGDIAAREELDTAIILKIQVPQEINKYIVKKGSIAIDGVSLTVVEVIDNQFSVSLIPHTAGLTTLAEKKTGDAVNLETDIIGRYIEKLFNTDARRSESKVSMSLLVGNGFI